ncbi:PREDICTED: homeobox-leucine zipper protein HOX11 [Ipomoea nil]|uniref:homeobox-leucine zipper protein HOX11 n=1 Tax=Ipomoea nil TaxID=35883 RepID=UPI0009012FBD|nr:PREDICTED: homeobox-leucine zipper protein HOX11 [Ipomoea nil]
MELALSLGGSNGNPTRKPFALLESKSSAVGIGGDLGFCMENMNNSGGREEPPPPVQLDLLPLSPVHRRQSGSQLLLPWLPDNLGAEAGVKALDMNRRPAGAVAEEAEDAAALSSPNSAASSFKMDFSIFRNGLLGKRDSTGDGDRERGGSSNSRASDDDENGLGRKKLRLTKDQSAFLEESFKEHNTLNPKQKLALAKQLNLRPRQVEVWFQNRRARTKLKQTEVDCEYLKRCCETLTEENRRLQKELQELRALKASQPFYMQLPATTLTMCPSCERVASSTAAATPTTAAAAHGGAKPKLFPFPPPQVHAPQAAS